VREVGDISGALDASYMRLNTWCLVFGVVVEWDDFPVNPQERTVLVRGRYLTVAIIGEESTETEFEKDSWILAFVLITDEEPTALAVRLATSSTQPPPTVRRPTPRRIRPGPLQHRWVCSPCCIHP
jgi:hypothetical protein